MKKKNFFSKENIDEVLTFFDTLINDDLVLAYSQKISLNKNILDYFMLRKPQEQISKDQDFFFDHLCENPEHEMFLFNVLLCRQEMSMLFLTRGTNSIGHSLIATKIFKFYANEFDDDLNICEEMAKYFESLACDILKLFNENDELYSQLTLIRKLKEFENVTCMRIATSSRDLNFISMQSFQNVLDRIWYHRMLPDTNKAKLLICLVFPFLAPAIIKYRQKIDHNKEKSEGLIKSQKKDETKETEVLEPTDEENPGKTLNDEELIKKIDAEFSNDFFDLGNHGNYNYFQFLYHFLNTPFVKFIYHQIWYLLFLLLFSYVVLCDFSKFETPKYPTTSFELAISIPEIVLMIWIFAFVTEEIRKFLKEEMKKYYIINTLIGDFWENINIGAILLYLVAFILRFIKDDQCFKAARIIMAVDIILWFFKSLKAYTFLRQLGPKLYMIREMLVQLAYFFLIVLLFMFAFGVSTTALMFQNQALDKHLLKNVFLPAYFMIGGEYYTRTVIMDASSGQCSDSSPYSECPEETGSSVALALYVIYLIFLNILLVNLLIAIFNNTYDTIEQEANKIWNSQRYALVTEYYNKPLLPAPFVLLSYLFSVFKFILRKSSMIFEPKRGRFSKFLSRNQFFRYLTHKWNYIFVYILDEKEERKIIRIEESLTNELINLREKDKKDNFEVKVEQNYEKLDILSSRFEEFMEKGNFALNEKIQAIDTSLNNLLKSMK
ncbi:unnamed protein product [Brachionus calyciflorus]|uniref:Ion transport domain-containing protein n=1 Tax=Brachionus calyciflorus TaxID=104777 RepID=A0A814FCZ8_9BILA|nr:unnamed protein product [Brachionus calyciflorus]